MKVYNSGDVMVCPHCAYAYDAPIEDFVAPGSLFEFPEECEDCDDIFYVREISSGKFEVRG